MKMKQFVIPFALLFVSAPLRADVPAGNFWHNPTFESGENLDQPGGTPTFWQRGGSNTSIDQVTTANSVSATHALAVNDPGAGPPGSSPEREPGAAPTVPSVNLP